MIESLDAETSRLLSALTPAQKANTVVIFVGDNGTPTNVLQDYPRRHGKGTLYQGGVRVPFVISGAGVTRKGVREPALVHVADVFSTVLALTGSTQSLGTENSLNLAPYLVGSQPERRSYNYSEISNGQSSGWTVRNEQYKLISFDDATQEFYDLIADSLETNDLLSSGLTQAQLAVKADFEAEATQQRDDYSCRDFIQNGDELGIDCGGSFCDPCTSSLTGTADVDVQLSPNPVREQLFIESTAHTIKYVEIFDVQGRLIKQVVGVNASQAQLSLQGLKPQILVVRLRAGDQMVVRQIVKQ